MQLCMQKLHHGCWVYKYTMYCMWIADFYGLQNLIYQIGKHISLSMHTVNKNGGFNYFWQTMKKIGKYPNLSKSTSSKINHYTVSLRQQKPCSRKALRDTCYTMLTCTKGSLQKLQPTYRHTSSDLNYSSKRIYIVKKITLSFLTIW